MTIRWQPGCLSLEAEAEAASLERKARALRQIVEGIKARARGYPISGNGIEKAVRRMVDGGEAERVGFGRYRFLAKRKDVATLGL